jgi:lipoate-protein ligase A
MASSIGDSARGTFAIIDRVGKPAELLDVSPPQTRLARIAHPCSRAVVLGSTQRAEDFDQSACYAAGYEIVRRKSGGGGVLVSPGDQVWLDVFLPVSDPLFQKDVNVATHWLGELWQAVLSESIGASHLFAVHRDKALRNAWSSSVCFCGLGPGEVTADGYKVVGVSQRRSRHGAWLFSMALVHFDPARLCRLVSPSLGDREALLCSLTDQVKGLEVDGAMIEDVLRRQLG